MSMLTCHFGEGYKQKNSHNALSALSLKERITLLFIKFTGIISANSFNYGCRLSMDEKEKVLDNREDMAGS